MAEKTPFALITTGAEEEVKQVFLSPMMVHSILQSTRQQAVSWKTEKGGLGAIF